MLRRWAALAGLAGVLLLPIATRGQAPPTGASPVVPTGMGSALSRPGSSNPFGQPQEPRSYSYFARPQTSWFGRPADAFHTPTGTPGARANVFGGQPAFGMGGRPGVAFVIPGREAAEQPDFWTRLKNFFTFTTTAAATTATTAAATTYQQAYSPWVRPVVRPTPPNTTQAPNLTNPTPP